MKSMENNFILVLYAYSIFMIRDFKLRDDCVLNLLHSVNHADNVSIALLQGKKQMRIFKTIHF